jgi:beta-xylosidase
MFRFFLCLALSAPLTQGQTSGANGTHDPSRMLASDGKVYVYSTGGGSKSSSDGLVWASGPALQPKGWPQWVKDFAPANQGLWAPDGIYLNGLYFLFYSLCARSTSGSNATPCAIGVQTSPTLNPASDKYAWTDRGMVVANSNAEKFGAIDPAPVLDAVGNLWVVWGGGYTNASTAQSIWVTRLDNATGLPLTTDPAYQPPAVPGHPLALGHKEGPYIHFHGGTYFLFWQTGGCCSGTASTYQINMARSNAITGPYTGDRVFYKTNGNIHGPGHIGIYTCGGMERFTYHYYPTGQSVLGENELTWGGDGWPVAGPVAAGSLTLGCTASEIAKSVSFNAERHSHQFRVSNGIHFTLPQPQFGGGTKEFDLYGRRYLPALSIR